MKKRIEKLFRRPAAKIAAIILLIAVIASAAALAEFTQSYRAQRVIATYGSNEQLFSSNYLMPLQSGGKASIYTVYAYTDEPLYSRTLTICNYVQGYGGIHWFGKNIPYTLTAQLVKLVDGEPVPLEGAELSALTGAAFLDTDGTTHLALDGSDITEHPLTQNSLMLSHVQSNADAFTVVFPKAMLTNDAYFLITAEPTPGLGLDKIAAYLNISTRQSVTAKEWKMELQDKTANRSPSEFSGFNYQLYGSGKGSITISWDATEVELDKRFLPSGTSGTENGYTTYEFDVDDENGANSYDILFFLKKKQNAFPPSPAKENTDTIRMHFEPSSNN